MEHMTLKQLRYFVTTGELGSITKAAQRLFITQPSISGAISQLEKMSGVPLFKRYHSHGVALTPAGELLFERAKRLLAESDDLLKYAQSLSIEANKVLNIAAYHSYAQFLLPPLMKIFMDKFPDINLSCDELDQKSILSGLHKGKYEIAFGYDLALTDEFDFIELSENPPFIVLSCCHPLADREHLSIEELANHSMVLLDWPLSSDYFENLFKTVGVSPKIDHRVSSVSMALELVSRNFGYIIFNIPLQSNQQKQYPNLRSIPIKGSLQSLRVGIISIKSKPLSEATSALQSIAVEYSKTTGISACN